MNKVILYFGYVAFFIICLYLVSFICAIVLIALGENLKKRKHKKDIIRSEKSQLISQKNSNLNKIKIIVNAYDGIYKLLVYKTGKIPLNWLRKCIYRNIFKMNIGKNVVIHKGLEIRGGGIKLL